MRPCFPDWLSDLSEPMREARPHKSASHAENAIFLTFDSNSTSDYESDVLKTKTRITGWYRIFPFCGECLN